MLPTIAHGANAPTPILNKTTQTSLAENLLDICLTSALLSLSITQIGFFSSFGVLVALDYIFNESEKPEDNNNQKVMLVSIFAEEAEIKRTPQASIVNAETEQKNHLEEILEPEDITPMPDKEDSARFQYAYESEPQPTYHYEPDMGVRSIDFEVANDAGQIAGIVKKHNSEQAVATAHPYQQLSPLKDTYTSTATTTTSIKPYSILDYELSPIFNAQEHQEESNDSDDPRAQSHEPAYSFTGLTEYTSANEDNEYAEYEYIYPEFEMA